MYNSLLTNIVLLLSLFHITAFAGEAYAAGPLLSVRQTTTTTDAQCMDYSMVANMSTIAANSTYRTAFLQKSPVGVILNQRMLDAATAKLPALIKNAALNQKCGNLTATALTESAKNFTQGIVAQFTGVTGLEGTVQGADAPLVVIVLAVVGILGSVWMFAP